ncbi:multidrug efflux system membrane fusion protein [Ochrobactrum sp. 19YEA23]|uniref:efflux RND transporter periplasmic adaptor subunit n=1 Tax=Ochrobactrum sp. 19YEA23 TaxID=3039854 RepID=UPI002A289B91|nr:multidrug efflux system membrane fusion protein [Ochrobactrum sp. 19YEA23]
MKRWVVWGVPILLVAGAAYVGWQHATKQNGASAPNTVQTDSRKSGNRSGGGEHAVKVAVATAGSLPIQRTAIGTVVAVASTAVNSPEAGNVAILNVKDGAIVKKGDLIAQLDDRAIRATVVKDQASVAKSQATLNDAQLVLKRTQDLVTKGIDTSQAGDDALAALRVAEAQLQVDQAQLAADQVTLDDTKILAPFDGQLGVVSVSLGAYLSAGSPVATITQMKPIYADFTLPETDLALIRETLSTGTLKATATAVSADGKDTSESGPVNFLDNNIDAASGTVRLRATLDNQSGNFWPGQSLRVLVEAGQADNLVLVPGVAVQPQENGSISYVVKTDNSIEVRPVTVALRANGMAGLSAGLQPGEKVVTEGQASLANGSKVKLASTDAETKVSSN